MDFNKLKEELRRDEGCVLHAYEDHLSYVTIGIGRMIDSRKNGGISEDEAEYLLHNDVNKIATTLDSVIPWWKDLTDNRQRAVLNMSFQLGVNGLLNFKKMLAALEVGDYRKACVEGLNSKWAKEDTPRRAQRVTRMILEG